ncbi:MAG: hypothetical protein KZQ77_10680 [Candidatus Thiodiazotropha sp. (ex Notomyrtea botanica)]|nr:hypothetical protein [Candidatus Thiodiazotropha sp. (ex Notomyrtea botanica)]
MKLNKPLKLIVLLFVFWAGLDGDWGFLPIQKMEIDMRNPLTSVQIASGKSALKNRPSKYCGSTSAVNRGIHQLSSVVVPVHFRLQTEALTKMQMQR